jgi:hypothetical protein
MTEREYVMDEATTDVGSAEALAAATDRAERAERELARLKGQASTDKSQLLHDKSDVPTSGEEEKSNFATIR